MDLSRRERRGLRPSAALFGQLFPAGRRGAGRVYEGVFQRVRHADLGRFPEPDSQKRHIPFPAGPCLREPGSDPAFGARPASGGRRERRAVPCFVVGAAQRDLLLERRHLRDEQSVRTGCLHLPDGPVVPLSSVFVLRAGFQHEEHVQSDGRSQQPLHALHPERSGPGHGRLFVERGNRDERRLCVPQQVRCDERQPGVESGDVPVRLRNSSRAGGNRRPALFHRQGREDLFLYKG